MSALQQVPADAGTVPDVRCVNGRLADNESRTPDIEREDFLYFRAFIAL
jgi:hypothetical protein